jgi:hypothetical protein
MEVMELHHQLLGQVLLMLVAEVEVVHHQVEQQAQEVQQMETLILLLLQTQVQVLEVEHHQLLLHQVVLE